MLPVALSAYGMNDCRLAVYTIVYTAVSYVSTGIWLEYEYPFMWIA